MNKWIWIGAAAVLAIGLVLAAPKFLPKDEVVLNQDAPPGSMDSMDGMDDGMDERHR